MPTITPSPKPYCPGGDLLTLVPAADWTPGMRQIIAYARRIARELRGCEITVDIAREATWLYGATYGRGRLVFNLSKCSHDFFNGGITDT